MKTKCGILVVSKIVVHSLNSSPSLLRYPRAWLLSSWADMLHLVPGRRTEKETWGGPCCLPLKEMFGSFTLCFRFIAQYSAVFPLLPEEICKCSVGPHKYMHRGTFSKWVYLCKQYPEYETEHYQHPKWKLFYTEKVENMYVVTVTSFLLKTTARLNHDNLLNTSFRQRLILSELPFLSERYL